MFTSFLEKLVVTVRDAIKWEQANLKIVNFFKYPGICLQTDIHKKKATESIRAICDKNNLELLSVRHDHVSEKRRSFLYRCMPFDATSLTIVWQW
jgi:hypothetical protein